MKLLCLIVLAAAPLGGCSVGMALHGADNPDLSVLYIGNDRREVESELGKPERWYPNDRRATYHYSTGESGSAGRAVGHAIGDILTLGLWEVVGTPVEAFQKHRKWAVTVWYDYEDYVVRHAEPRER